MKKTVGREKTTLVPEKDLAWVKGSSGYMISVGLGGDPPPPEGGE